MAPKISVIMSVYNGGKYLFAAIDSVLAQSYPDFELIIIDDASTDDTHQILAQYAAGDDRIILLRNNVNMGLTRSLNKGLGVARGIYVARQDHDDVSLPLRFEKQIQFLDANPSTILVSCNFDVIDASGNFVRRKNLNCESVLIEWNLIFSNYLEGHSQVMFRKGPVLSLGGYRESLAYAQDYDLWQRLLRFGRVVILPEVLLNYRVHQERVTHLAADKQFENVLTVSAVKIAELSGEHIDKREVKNLWIFWCLVYRYDLIPNKSATWMAVHTRLKSIFSAFIAGRVDKDPAKKKNGARLIRRAIARRYYRWGIFELNQRLNLIRTALMFAGVVYWLRFDFITLGLGGLRRLVAQKIKTHFKGGGKCVLR